MGTWVPYGSGLLMGAKVLVYFCIFGNYSSFDEVLVFTHRMLQKKSIDVHITLCGKNFKCKNYYRFTVVHYNVQY